MQVTKLHLKVGMGSKERKGVHGDGQQGGGGNRDGQEGGAENKDRQQGGAGNRDGKQGIGMASKE